MLLARSTYEDLIRDFRWEIPKELNLASICLARATSAPDDPAIIDIGSETTMDPVVWSFGALERQTARFANALTGLGIKRGDRLAIILPQTPDTAVAHLAAWRTGAITVPMSVLFGETALTFRLNDCGARAVVTNPAGAAQLSDIRCDIPDLEFIISTGDGPAGAHALSDLVAHARDQHDIVQTGADDPAVMVYTSGTTGQPKGALHGHRVLHGHLPGVQMSHDFLPQKGDRLWTPADWAWAGGLFNILLPGLYFGIPTLAGRMEKFDPEAALDLMARHNVRNSFIPPTALKILRSVKNIPDRFDLNLRTIASGGEALGSETFEWAKKELGLTINEFYGQTECNLVLSSCAAIHANKAGTIGLPVPGHEVAIIGPDGLSVPAGEQGDIGIRAPDPVMFLNYWNQPQASADKFRGDWLITGDQGVADADGYIRFVGRDDDVITSASYRIGPAEIEDCLVSHSAVSLAAVIGKPDPVRTEIVKAFIVLAPGQDANEALTDDIKSFVRSRLSAHQQPREISFVEDIPLTTTGKVIRRHFRRQAEEEAQAEFDIDLSKVD